MRKAFQTNVPRRRPRLRPASEATAPAVEQASPPLARPAGEAGARRDRLEKIRRHLAEAAQPAPRIDLGTIKRKVIEGFRPARLDPAPAVPAQGPGTTLSLLEAMGAELARARERERALRGELARAAGRARGAGEPLAAASKARGPAERLAAAHADYLRQAVLWQRSRSAHAAGPGGPTSGGDPGSGSGGAADGEAMQLETLGRIRRAASAAGAAGA